MDKARFAFDLQKNRAYANPAKWGSGRQRTLSAPQAAVDRSPDWEVYVRHNEEPGVGPSSLTFPKS